MCEGETTVLAFFLCVTYAHKNTRKSTGEGFSEEGREFTLALPQQNLVLVGQVEVILKGSKKIHGILNKPFCRSILEHR